MNMISSNLSNKFNYVIKKIAKQLKTLKNFIKVLLIRIMLISTIISAEVRLLFLFLHDEQNDVLSIINKKYKFHTCASESYSVLWS